MVGFLPCPFDMFTSDDTIIAYTTKEVMLNLPLEYRSMPKVDRLYYQGVISNLRLMNSRDRCRRFHDIRQ